MRNAIPISGVMLSCVLLASTNGVWAQDWPQWRGPNRDAKADGFKAPATWPKELTQKWKITVGDGVATPALVGDKLYVFTREEGNEVVRCLDAASGKEIWQDKYETQAAAGPAASFAGPRSSPAVADSKVVTLGVRGILSCYDAAKGEKLWRKSDTPAGWPKFFASSSPMIVDGLCIVQLGGPKTGAIVAYDLSSGDEKWKAAGDSPAYGSPVLMTVDGTKLIIALTEMAVVGVNAADGKQVWQMPFPVSGGRGYNAATPVVDGQTLIVSGSNRGTKAVKLSREGDGFVAKELWSNPEQSVMYDTPVLKDGFLYGLSQGNQFFCLDAASGKTAWTAAAPAGQAGGGQQGGRGGRGGRMGGGYGSIVDAGSVLLGLTPTSQLVVMAPGAKAYTELAKIKVADAATYAYPIPSGNRLFIKDQNSITLWTID